MCRDRTHLHLQHLLQLIVSRSADLEFRSVLEDCHAAVLGVELETGEAFDVKNGGAVNPYESFWIEKGLKIG